MIHSAPKVHESSIAAEQVPFLLVHVALWDLSLELELVNGLSLTSFLYALETPREECQSVNKDFCIVAITWAYEARIPVADCASSLCSNFTMQSFISGNLSSLVASSGG